MNRRHLGNDYFSRGLSLVRTVKGKGGGGGGGGGRGYRRKFGKVELISISTLNLFQPILDMFTLFHTDPKFDTLFQTKQTKVFSRINNC